MTETRTAVRDCRPFAAGQVTGWEWEASEAGAPTLVFAHATGFNASAYKSLLGQLSPGVRVVAYNQRGHGTTQLAADPSTLRSWEVYAEDLIAFVKQACGHPVHFAGHSMGAIAGVMAAAAEPDLFRSLTLFDPVLMRPGFYALLRSPFGGLLRRRITLASIAERRRAEWADQETVTQSYRGRGIFARLSDRVLEDYLEDGLTKTEGGVRLSCSPAWEAATFRAQGHPVWRSLRSFSSLPLCVVRAERDSTFIVNPAKLRSAVPHATFELMRGCGHFAPLEQPDLARTLLEQPIFGASGPA